MKGGQPCEFGLLPCWIAVFCERRSWVTGCSLAPREALPLGANRTTGKQTSSSHSRFSFPSYAGVRLACVQSSFQAPSVAWSTFTCRRGADPPSFPFNQAAKSLANLSIGFSSRSRSGPSFKFSPPVSCLDYPLFSCPLVRFAQSRRLFQNRLRRAPEYATRSKARTSLEPPSMQGSAIGSFDVCRGTFRSRHSSELSRA